MKRNSTTEKRQKPHKDPFNDQPIWDVAGRRKCTVHGTFKMARSHLLPEFTVDVAAALARS